MMPRTLEEPSVVESTPESFTVKCTPTSSSVALPTIVEPTTRGSAPERATLPTLSHDVHCYRGFLPPGLCVVPECIDGELERSVIAFLDSQPWDHRLARRTQHYGFRFDYENLGYAEVNQCNSEEVSAIPSASDTMADGGIAATTSGAIFTPIPEIFSLGGRFDIPEQYDQITVNEYFPSQGISAHIDTHSCFEDGFCTVSLLSSVAMTFSKVADDETTHHPKFCSLYLSQRSCVTFHGESRLAWKHSIPKRKTDLVLKRKSQGSRNEPQVADECQLAEVVVPRSRRLSITYRKIKKKAGCWCAFPSCCDWQDPSSMQLPNRSAEIMKEKRKPS